MLGVASEMLDEVGGCDGGCGELDDERLAIRTEHKELKEGHAIGLHGLPDS